MITFFKNYELIDINHFVVDNKMVYICFRSKREHKDYKLTRYAWYLIAQNIIQTEKDANKAHSNIGNNIRDIIKKNGGIMPEDLPTPKKSLKQLEKENKKC